MFIFPRYLGLSVFPFFIHPLLLAWMIRDILYRFEESFLNEHFFFMKMMIADGRVLLSVDPYTS
jgi:hypothetical protein